MSPSSSNVNPLVDNGQVDGNPAGLSEAEAQRRLVSEGPNELPTEKPRGMLSIAFGVAREPMFLMLVAAGSLYLLMGEPSDALMLLGFVFVVMTITIIQERRTERALDALRDLSSPRALVIRDGSRRRIAGREVARGDLVILTEGDRVPADGILRQAINLSTNESLLTGEPIPVRKVASACVQTMDKPGGDDLPSVFSGTMVTAGQGVIEVIATGAHTELGKIGKALQKVEPEATLLQKETGHIVKIFAIVGLIACALVAITFAITRGGDADVWKQGLLAGISMAMAVLPEEFPVVLTVFLALGAWRISRNNVLTRRMPAVETLGAATVLCVDKTGTLTQNRMTLRKLAAGANVTDISTLRDVLDGAQQSVLENAVLACKRDPFDPMERALHEAGGRLLKDTGHLHPEWSLIREFPLSPELLAVSHAWYPGSGEELVVAAKGAPEAIAGLCHLNAVEQQALAGEVATLASEGLRVLGVARGKCPRGALPDAQLELSLSLVGLIAFEDPLREAVPAAVNECRTAGVRVVMITGDYPVTAQSIARQAGLENCENVISGPELDSMSDQDLARRIKNVQVFARVVPEQKLRIVDALKASGEIVAMTGDGVNDAPALKSAHIGIAMGGRGTDVARESASLVLLDDDFASIVTAIRLGRRIFDNIKKAIAFILAVHVPIAGLSMLPVFFTGWPLLLLPIHIVFLELIIDPSCSLIFEAEEAEADVMQRPPRRPDERLFSLRSIWGALAQGASVLVACLAVFLLSWQGHTADAARALTFATLVSAFLVIILVNRSQTRSAFSMLRVPNTAMRWVLLGTCTLLAVVLLVPAAQTLLHFAPLHAADLTRALGAGLVSVLWFDLLKHFRNSRAAST